MKGLFRIIVLSVSLVVSLCLVGCARNTVPVKQDALLSEDSISYPSIKNIKAKFYYKDSADKRMARLEEVLKNRQNAPNTDLYYQYNYADLNGDLSNEVLVWLVSKDNTLKRDVSNQFIIFDAELKPIFESFQVVAPIVVLNNKTNGWADLAYFIDKGQFYRLYVKDNRYVNGGKSNENVIEFQDLEGVCYLSNAINEFGFQIK